MTPEEFRRHGRAAIDWIADYMERIETFPVLSRVEPGWVRAQLPAAAPEQAEPFESILADLDRVILPGITHWQSPSFFGYFPANASGASILGDLISSGLGVQGMLWATSPACTELETHALDWMVTLLDLPQTFSSKGRGGGVIQDSASSATLCALVAARERAGGGSVNRAGVTHSYVTYASTQAHSSVEKAVRIAGLGADQFRQVEVDTEFAMDPQALEAAIEADRQDGRIPTMVVATVGTTSSLAIDPLPAIAEVCSAHHVWLHVDAAMAGIAGLCPEFRHIHDGLSMVDSYCVNPHKWMGVNFDCDLFYVTDRRPLIRALSVLPDYLRNQATESGAVIDYRDWQVPLGRRFRALKLWFVLRGYGAETLRRMVRHHVALAGELAQRIRQDPDFEIAAPVRLNLVCFRHRGGDQTNQAILDRLNSSGAIYLTHTRLGGRLTLRMSIGGLRTEWRHVQHAWQLIRATATAVTA